MTVEIGIVLALLAQTAGLFYWGGRIQRQVHQQEKEQALLRKYNAEEVAPRLPLIDALWDERLRDRR